MKHWVRITSLVAMITATILMIMPVDALAQRSRGGGSFGGSRRSFSAPRSSPRSSPRGGGSFGGSRRSPSSPTTRPYSSRPTTRQSSQTPISTRNTFGGSRLNSSGDYTSRYGVPRKTERTTIPGANGGQNYVVNRYGGMGDGFMMGYLMGSIPWYYSMPFHPAFYYSRPYTVMNPDGTTSVYPGTFSWGTLFFVLLLVGGGAYILYVWLRRKRQRRQFGGVDMSRSSFS